MDGVRGPREEAVAAAERAAPPGTRKRKGWRQFRLASCATLPVPERKGKALHPIRSGRMPQGEGEGVCRTLAPDVGTLFRKQPVLEGLLLADGAPELWKLLAGSLKAETLGVPVPQLVDLWHLFEKLGRAARLLSGEAQGRAVLHGWRLRLRNRPGSVAEILPEVYNSGKEELVVGKSRPVHEAIPYWENPQARLNYASARRRG